MASLQESYNLQTW